VHGIRVIFNKVMFLVTDHLICIFPFPIFVIETVVNDAKKYHDLSFHLIFTTKLGIP
jgi:hypothetical protein